MPYGLNKISVLFLKKITLSYQYTFVTMHAKEETSAIEEHTSSCSIVWPSGMMIWLPVNLVGLIPGYAYEPAFNEAAE